jgi:hypothetical protein
MENNGNEMSASIYRYNFSKDFMEELYEFSKIHQYDHRKDFKEAWLKWQDENTDAIEAESRRLVELDYTGDILDKMFKSARYYFRKKNVVKAEPKERKCYVTVEKKMLDAMNRYITEHSDEKPSESFVCFCENHKDELREEVSHLLKNKMEKDEIINKIKKTYKNRYFIIVNRK